MEIFSGVNLHLESAIYKVLTHLQDTFLHFWGIPGIDNILSEFLIIDHLCLFLVFQHQHSFIVATENIVNINPN